MLLVSRRGARSRIWRRISRDGCGRRLITLSIRNSQLVPFVMAAVLLAGCSSGAPTTTTVETASSVATATQADPGSTTTAFSSSASPSASASAVSGDAVKAVANAVGAQSSPDKMRQGLSSTVPGSPAHAYLSHLANVAEARLDGGSQSTDQSIVSAGGDSFKLCNTPSDEKSCVTLGGFKVDPSGKVVNLTVNGQDVAPRLTSGNGQAVAAGGAKFTFLTAYKSIQSDALFVTVKAETGGKAITINIFSATYRGPDGKQRQASDAGGPTELDANSNAIVYMAFQSVQPGGKVTLGGCSPKDCSGSYEAVLQVG